MCKEWFETWFDSPYYHQLYAHRDENEAEFFLTRLVQHLQIPKQSKILDLACGKGRHAQFLHRLGFDVTGIDLSGNSICEAKKLGGKGLHFIQGDMRHAFPQKYHYIFNLFTSFGYFENENENLEVLKNVNDSLEPGGLFVLDYLNATKLLNDLCTDEARKVDDIIFHIQKSTKNGFIEKKIDFEADGKTHTYCEKVQLLEISSLEKMLNATQLQIISTFGSYSLSPFDQKSSDRLIIVAQKG